MTLVNIMEEVVKIKVDSVMELYPDLCKCEHCRMDVMALTLNSLPPRYVAHSMGNIFAHFDLYSDQNQANIIAALATAIRQVQNNPRHDIDMPSGL